MAITAIAALPSYIASDLQGFTIIQLTLRSLRAHVRAVGVFPCYRFCRTCGKGPSPRNRPLDPLTLAIHDNRCLSAFLVVLRDTGDDGKQPWIMSIRELQMTSLLFCAACRDVPTRHLGVSRRIPPHLLSADDDAYADSDVSSSIEGESCDKQGVYKGRMHLHGGRLNREIVPQPQVSILLASFHLTL